MIIMGIDPGSRITGYGFIKKEGSHVSHVDNGIIHCESAPQFNDRLVLIFEKIQELIGRFHPTEVAVENIFHAKNAMSSLKLGHARGAALVAAGLLKLPLFEYTPLEVKKSVTGYGVAPKEQMQKMTRALLHLPEIAEENASDALAVALCHAHTRKLGSVMR